MTLQPALNITTAENKEGVFVIQSVLTSADIAPDQIAHTTEALCDVIRQAPPHVRGSGNKSEIKLELDISSIRYDDISRLTQKDRLAKPQRRGVAPSGQVFFGLPETIYPKEPTFHSMLLTVCRALETHNTNNQLIIEGADPTINIKLKDTGVSKFINQINVKDAEEKSPRRESSHKPQITPTR